MLGMFRSLRAEEIELRVARATEKGASLLAYKDARADMNILDETVGPFNWKREHTRDNKNCVVSIWDKEKSQWVSKEDTGTESFTEQEKGLASDSFKRACFNWGIGRELYTAPFIWVGKKYVSQFKGKYVCREKFKVTHIETVAGVIVAMIIVDSEGNQVFKMGSKAPNKPNKKVSKSMVTMTRVEMIDAITKALDTDIKLKKVLNHYNVPAIREMEEGQLKECCKMLKIV